MKQLLSNLLDVIFPPRCLCCETCLVEDHNQPLCRNCTAGIRWINGPIGASDIPLALFDHITACCKFEGPMMEAIHRFKYEQRTDLARPFGHLLSQCGMVFSKTAVLVPVPLSRQRLRERGYNQAELLAHSLRRHGGSRVAPHVLIRSRDTAPQVGQERAARLANVQGAFAVRDASSIRDRDIVLIDDVMTTGATLIACAKALRKAGAHRVSALVVAVA